MAGEVAGPGTLPAWLCRVLDSRRTVYVLTLLGAAAAAIAAIVKEGGWKLGWLALGAVCLVCVKKLDDRRADLLRARREEAEADALSARKAAERATAGLIVVLGDYFEPITGLIAQMSTTAKASERRRQGGLLMQKVVEAAVAICGPERHGLIRANFFELREDGLRFVTHHGRGTPPRQQLPAEALDLALAKGHVLLPDVANAPHPDAFADATYRTFISSSVYAGDTVLGLLTVDAVDPGMLKKQDLRSAIVLSHMLGAGLALQK